MVQTRLLYLVIACVYSSFILLSISQIAGDGRNDSPGHCAQYLTYTFMEDVPKDILQMEVRDKRQTALVSTRMEVDALLKGLDFLMQTEGLTVTEMVTDAHTTITSRMRKFVFLLYSFFSGFHGIHESRFKR